MKKGLLICAGGMSTTMMAKELEKLARADGEEWKWDAMGMTGSYSDVLDEYSYVFMSPQIVFMHAAIKKHCEEAGVPHSAIQPQNYIVLKAGALWDIVKESTK